MEDTHTTTTIATTVTTTTKKEEVKTMRYNDNSGCATVVAALVVVALVIFLGPWVVQMGYNAIKLDFNLPDLNYWQFFWATNALQVIFKTSSSITTRK